MQITTIGLEFRQSVVHLPVEPNQCLQAPSVGHAPKKKLRMPSTNRVIESGFSLPPKLGSFSLVKYDDWKPV
jgi:hypothetical protein